MKNASLAPFLMMCALDGGLFAQSPEPELPGVKAVLVAARASQAIFEPASLTLTISLASDAAPLKGLKRSDLIRAACVVAAGPDRKGRWAETTTQTPEGEIDLFPGESFALSFVVRIPEGVAPPGSMVTLQWIAPSTLRIARSNELPIALRDARNPTVVLDTSEGSIVMELLPEVAPNHVANFVSLAQKGFYDGLKWHRVVPNFVVQAGCPSGDGSGGPGYKIGPEFTETPFTKGVVGMARGGETDSAGSQFFLCVADAPALNNKYTAFGRILEGQEVADRISIVARDQRTEQPLKPVTIKKATVALPAEYALPEVKKA